MKIVSYNINGFRSSLEKGLLDWIEENEFDIVCLQETKISESKIPKLLIESAGYQQHWHPAEKPGYSGVATLSRVPPGKVFPGIGIPQFDVEGRVLRTDFENFTLLNCYFPNGGSGEIRQKYKMQFLDTLYAYTERLIGEGCNVIVVGDYNIAHTRADLNNPSGNLRTSGFLPEERDWMTEWMQSGMVDAFRHLYPDKTEYTWWRFNAGAKERNKGWRLDYQSVSDSLVDRVIDVVHRKEMDLSDHCPVIMEIDL